MNQLFSTYQKLTLWIFIVVGAATFVFGILNFQKSIVLPFARRGGANGFQTADEQEKARTQKLKTQDTDGDTITDYDELYVFRTSPFLEDTDSDGVTDGKEIAAATDPNCPQGKTCRQALLATAGADTSAASGGAVQGSAAAAGTAQGSAATTTAPQAAIPDGDTIVQVITDSFGDISTLTPARISQTLTAMSTADLKTFLGKLGIPEGAISKADDATLRKLVQESLIEIVGSASAAPAAGSASAGGSADSSAKPQAEGKTP